VFESSCERFVAEARCVAQPRVVQRQTQPWEDRQADFAAEGQLASGVLLNRGLDLAAVVVGIDQHDDRRRASRHEQHQHHDQDGQNFQDLAHSKDSVIDCCGFTPEAGWVLPEA
jgi:hypothetical protein